MGMHDTKPISIWVNNLGVILNASNSESTMNRKHIVLAYHFIRENVANDVVKIRKVDTKDNYADPFTMALDNRSFHEFFYKVQTN